MKEIVFLYFDGLHKIFHSVTVVEELARSHPGLPIRLITSMPEYTRVLQKQLPPLDTIRYTGLRLPFRYTYLSAGGRMYPPYLRSLKKARPFIEDAAVVVSATHETARYCRELGISGPKMIYMFHGCGQMEYGFDPQLAAFDHILVPGPYYHERLVGQGIIKPERCTVTGYPKLDLLAARAPGKTEWFEKDQPTVLYAPHWNPEFSSYRLFARELLEYFTSESSRNLIFAPHIQVKHWARKFGYDIDLERYASGNIRIDFGSIHSVNLDYNRIADVYIGDVSSQGIEWMAVTPRPMIFINTHKPDWAADPQYTQWKGGTVVPDMAGLTRALSAGLPDMYKKEQEYLVNRVITGTGASGRGRVAQLLYGISDKV